MPRRHVASDGLAENFRDSPTQHWAAIVEDAKRQPAVFRARLSGLVMSIDGDPGGTRRKLSFRAAQRVVVSLFNRPIQFDRLLQAFDSAS